MTEISISVSDSENFFINLEGDIYYFTSFIALTRFLNVPKMYTYVTLARVRHIF